MIQNKLIPKNQFGNILINFLDFKNLLNNWLQSRPKLKAPITSQVNTNRENSLNGFKLYL